MGSHDNYINRYPPEFTRWGTPNVYEPLLDYDNSIAYTDKFLQDVFTYSKENLNLQAMLYFSDHGANPLRKRNPDMNGFISLRIPMFLYLSDEYRQLYPATASVFRSHADSYFTNDLMYEVIAGILNIKSNHYNEENSLASPTYKYTRDTLTTRLGKSKLTEDNEEG
jgi:heptose-I-phosphate ethanolaminephosphotransferase